MTDKAIEEGGGLSEASGQVNEPTTVAHLQNTENENHHAVIVECLRVLLIQEEEEQWFAQGLELDYAAAGDTVDDVKERFQQGLGVTITEHLKIYGSVENLLRVAPQETWDLWLKADKHYNFTHATLHDLGDNKEIMTKSRRLPFSSIQFMEPATAVAMA